MQNFRALGLRPQTPKTATPLRISGYAPGTWSDFFSIQVEQIMWSSSGAIWTEKIDFNKADFEQHVCNENATIRVR